MRGWEGLYGRPISIKLRTAELGIFQLLEGARRVSSPVRPAIGAHGGTHQREHPLPADRSADGQHQPGHRPLQHLPRFEQAMPRVGPTAFDGDPVLQEQA